MWIKRQSLVRCCGRRFGNSVVTILPVQNKNFSGNPEELAKVPGAAQETQSHLNWQSLGIWQVRSKKSCQVYSSVMFCMRVETAKETLWIADIEELEEMDASELHVRRLNAKEVLTPIKGDNLLFPVADGTVRTYGGDQRLRPSTRDNPEAGNDFSSTTGDSINRHHVESRVKLYVPREETFPVHRRYQKHTYITWCDDGEILLITEKKNYQMHGQDTQDLLCKRKDHQKDFHCQGWDLQGKRKLLVLTMYGHMCGNYVRYRKEQSKTKTGTRQVNNIDDYWNVNGKKHCQMHGQAWQDSFSLNEKKTDGDTHSGWRLMSERNNLKTRRFLVKYVEAYVWCSEAQSKAKVDYRETKAPQCQTITWYLLHWTRWWRMLNILWKNARRKFENSMPAAMPCKTQGICRGETCSSIGKHKTICACIVEADESIRIRLEGVLHRYHEDHIAAKGTKEWIHWAITTWNISFSDASSIKNTRCKGSSGLRMRKTEKYGMATDESQKQERSDRWSKE